MASLDNIFGADAPAAPGGSSATPSLDNIFESAPKEATAPAAAATPSVDNIFAKIPKTLDMSGSKIAQNMQPTITAPKPADTSSAFAKFVGLIPKAPSIGTPVGMSTPQASIQTPDNNPYNIPSISAANTKGATFGKDNSTPFQKIGSTIENFFTSDTNRDVAATQVQRSIVNTQLVEIGKQLGIDKQFPLDTTKDATTAQYNQNKAIADYVRSNYDGIRNSLTDPTVLPDHPEMLGPTGADVIKNLDQYTKELGVRSTPTNAEVITIALSVPIAAELITPTVAGLLTLGTFAAIGGVEHYLLGGTVADKISESMGLNSGTQTMLNLVEMFGEGKALSSFFKVAPAIATKWTKNITETYMPGKTLTIDGAKIKDLFQTNTKMTSEEKQMYSDLYVATGRTSAQLKADIQNGVQIQIAPEKVISLVDKTWWSMVKGAVSVVNKAIGGPGLESFFPGSTEISRTPITATKDTPPVTRVQHLLGEGPGRTKAISDALRAEAQKEIAKYGPDLAAQALHENSGLSMSLAEAEAVIKEASTANTPEAQNAVIDAHIAALHAAEKTRLAGRTDEQIVKESNDYVDKNLESLTDKYLADNKNIIGADEAKEYVPGYSDNREINDQVSEAAGKIVDAAYAKKLETSKGEGNNTMLMMAGGTGVGKGTTLRGMGKEKSDYPIIFDTNLSDKGNAITRIDQALEAGYKVAIKVVSAPVDRAYDRALDRTERQVQELGSGRPVSAHGHIAAHHNHYDATLAVAEHYKNNDSVRFVTGVDNAGAGTPKEIHDPVAFLQDLVHNKEDENKLHTNLQQQRKDAFDQGRISQQTHDAYERVDAGRVEAPVRPVAQSSNKGSEGKAVDVLAPLKEEAAKYSSLQEMLPAELQGKTIAKAKVFGSSIKGGKYNDIDVAVFIPENELPNPYFVDTVQKVNIEYHIFADNEAGHGNFTALAADYDGKKPTVDIASLFSKTDRSNAKIIPNPTNRSNPFQVEYTAHGSVVHRNFPSEQAAQRWIDENVKGGDFSIKPLEEGGKDEVTTLYMEIIPGLSKTLAEDVVPGARSTWQAFKDLGMYIAGGINPTGFVDAKQLDAVMRAKGTYEEQLFKTQRAMASVEAMWNKLPVESRLDFMARIERDEPIPDEFKPLAELYKQRLDAAHAAYSEFKNLEYRANYFPHIVKEGGIHGDQTLGEFMPKVLRRRPLQGSRGYTKQRIFQDVQELYAAGFEMVSTNPEVIMQLHEQDVAKFVQAQEMLGKDSELAKMGALKYVPMGGDVPEGFARIDDAVVRRYLPPEIKVKEYYDEQVMTALNSIAESLGVTHERLASIGGKKLGVSYKGKDLIKTRMATPLPVLLHEIFHQIDNKYGMQDFMNDDHYGAEHKRQIAAEMRALADLRYEGKAVPASFKKYVRSGPEKMAVMGEAWLHAKDRFKETAPHLYDLFRDFVHDHKELRPILDLRAGLVYAEGTGTIDRGGLALAGEYWADEHLARIINNHLSPDFIRQNPIGRGLMATKNLLNGIQLGLSGFHATFVTADTMYSKMGIGLQKMVGGDLAEGLKDVASTPLAPIFYYRQGNKMFNMVSNKEGGVGFIATKNIGDGIDLGHNVDPKTLDMLHQYFVGGGSLHKRQYYNNIPVLEKFMDNLRSGNYIGAAARSPFALIEALRRPLFEHYIPRLKAGAFVDLYSSELQRLAPQIADGSLTPDTVARNVLNNIDNRMGELNYDNLFWNRTFKGAVMLSIRAPGFNLGTLREIGGALTQDIPRSLGATKASREQYKKYGFDFTPKMQYTLGMYLTLAIMGAIYQYLHTGKRPGSLLDLYYPQNGGTDANGNPMRMEIPSYNKDTYSAFHAPLRMVSNKSAPEASAIIDLLTNRDYFGDMIHNPVDPWTTQSKQMGLFLLSQFQPFTFQQIGNMSKGTTNTEQKMESMIGFIKAPQELIDSEFTKQLKDAYSAQYGPQGAKTPEEQQITTLKATARQQIQTKDYDNLVKTLELLKTLGAFANQKSLDTFVNGGELTPEERMYQGLSKENKQQLADAIAGKQPVYTDGQSVDDRSLIGTIVTYAKAIGTDPVTAFGDIFSGQTIRRLDNGTIIVDRMSLQDSQNAKRNLGGGFIQSGMTLDHTVSLELGGTNDTSNLKLVPAAQAAEDDKVENYLGNALRSGLINKDTAQSLEIQYKNRTITFDEVKSNVAK